eukprot:9066072-Heterocapsa_arctica.AAC.1
MASASAADIRVNGPRTFRIMATCIVLELVRPLRARVPYEPRDVRARGGVSMCPHNARHSWLIRALVRIVPDA